MGFPSKIYDMALLIRFSVLVMVLNSCCWMPLVDCPYKFYKTVNYKKLNGEFVIASDTFTIEIISSLWRPRKSLDEISNSIWVELHISFNGFNETVNSLKISKNDILPRIESSDISVAGEVQFTSSEKGVGEIEINQFNPTINMHSEFITLSLDESFTDEHSLIIQFSNIETINGETGKLEYSLNH